MEDNGSGVQGQRLTDVHFREHSIVHQLFSNINIFVFTCLWCCWVDCSFEANNPHLIIIAWKHRRLCCSDSDRSVLSVVLMSMWYWNYLGFFHARTKLHNSNIYTFSFLFVIVSITQTRQNGLFKQFPHCPPKCAHGVHWLTNEFISRFWCRYPIASWMCQGIK